MFLCTVSDAIDIFVEHFSSLDLTKVKTKRAESFTLILNPERFLYSKATMEWDAIESEDKLHAKLEGAYRTVMQDPAVPDECKKGLEVALNYHQNKRQNTSKWAVEK